MKKQIILLSAIFFITLPAFSKTAPELAVIKYSFNKENREFKKLSYNLFKKIYQINKKSKLFKLSSRRKSYKIAPQKENNLKSLKKISKKLRKKYLLTGNIDYEYENILITSHLYSIDKNKIVYTTEERLFLPENIKSSAKNILEKMNIFINSKTKYLKQITSSKGKEKKLVLIKWNKIPGIDKYQIYRSFFEKSSYEEIASTGKNRYKDKNADPGIKYWYRVAPVIDDIILDLSIPDFGFRKIDYPKGISLKKLKKTKKKKRPKVKDSSERARIKRDLKIIDYRVFNRIKLRIIQLMAGSYIKKGAITLIHNIDTFSISYKERSIYFIKKNKCVVKFYSNSLYRLYKKMKHLGTDGEELFDRLLKNSVLYSIKINETKNVEIEKENGTIQILPYYEAIGLSTEYFKDYKKWSSNTLMFQSSNGRLQKLMRKAKR